MDEDWRRLLAEQTADIAQIKKEVHRVYKYIRGQRLLGYIKIAIIILTIVAGVKEEVQAANVVKPSPASLSMKQ